MGTNDNSDIYDCDSNSDKTVSDKRIFTIINSDYIKKKLTEGENDISIHEKPPISVVPPVKIIPPITESLPVQILIKNEIILTPEIPEKLIDKIPLPPSKIGKEKSPKKILAEKNTILSKKEKITEKVTEKTREKITEKNVTEEASKRVKSVRFEKTNEVKIVDARDQAGSFCDVETSCGVLNDIKPSKMSRFRLPEWT